MQAGQEVYESPDGKTLCPLTAHAGKALFHGTGITWMLTVEYVYI